MRLVGPNGPNKVEGRVEYCSNGVWGTVNNYRFDVRDAHVVCRKLGYQHPRMKLFIIMNSLFIIVNFRCFSVLLFILFWSRIWPSSVYWLELYWK